MIKYKHNNNNNNNNKIQKHYYLIYDQSLAQTMIQSSTVTKLLWNMNKDLEPIFSEMPFRILQNFSFLGKNIKMGKKNTELLPTSPHPF